MLLWILILIVSLLLLLGGMLYLINRWSKLIYNKEYRKKHKLISKLVPMFLLVLIGVICGYCFNMVNTVLILIHLAIFWMLWDLICLPHRLRERGRKSLWKPSRLKPLWNVMPLILVVIYFGLGWFFAHHVFETRYDLTTDKMPGSLRIVQFADSHIGAVFHADGFARHMESILATDPDIVLITGDFVDDDTSREDMLGACQALSKLHPKYGVYFSFGNHDSGYYSEERRGWGRQELVEALEANGVIILEDQVELIDNRFYLIGRADYSKESEGHGGRLSMEEIMAGLDPSVYSVVMDHQPHDYDNQAAAQVDLVLSGHTHGGQLFPIGIIGERTGANCKTYGKEVRDKTTFLVTSGLGDWAIKFRSACIAEYVVIDVN